LGNYWPKKTQLGFTYLGLFLISLKREVFKNRIKRFRKYIDFKNQIASLKGKK